MTPQWLKWVLCKRIITMCLSFALLKMAKTHLHRAAPQKRSLQRLAGNFYTPKFHLAIVIELICIDRMCQHVSHAWASLSCASLSPNEEARMGRRTLKSR